MEGGGREELDKQDTFITPILLDSCLVLSFVGFSGPN